MMGLQIAVAPAAVGDLADIWELIARQDGAVRATEVSARIEAFCRSLANVPNIGSRHPERFAGLRSTGVPGLARVTVLFVVAEQSVTVIRIGYLGRNVWTGLPLQSEKRRK
jgi:plasmid stabilization system protein ParE